MDSKPSRTTIALVNAMLRHDDAGSSDLHVAEQIVSWLAKLDVNQRVHVCLQTNLESKPDADVVTMAHQAVRIVCQDVVTDFEARFPGYTLVIERRLGRKSGQPDKAAFNVQVKTKATKEQA